MPIVLAIYLSVYNNIMDFIDYFWGCNRARPTKTGVILKTLPVMFKFRYPKYEEAAFSNVTTTILSNPNTVLSQILFTASSTLEYYLVDLD
jgi:hypothetical protein